MQPTELTDTLDGEEGRGPVPRRPDQRHVGLRGSRAGQGLVAGVNAALWSQGRDAFVLGRDEAYIGVMIDDLVVSNPSEPYRMFTSRAEYRLLLRSDNAEERLVRPAAAIGLVDAHALAQLEARAAIKAGALRVLASVRSPEHGGKSLHELLLRPAVSMRDLEALSPELAALALDPEVRESLEIDVKYSGYVERQAQNVERMRSQEEVEIPSEIDYRALEGIANEAKDKLARLRPRTLGAAARIAGVRPPDVALLAVHIARQRRARPH